MECEKFLQLYIAMTFHTGMGNGLELKKLPADEKRDGK